MMTNLLNHVWKKHSYLHLHKYSYSHFSRVIRANEANFIGWIGSTQNPPDNESYLQRSSATIACHGIFLQSWTEALHVVLSVSQSCSWLELTLRRDDEHDGNPGYSSTNQFHLLSVLCPCTLSLFLFWVFLASWTYISLYKHDFMEKGLNLSMPECNNNAWIKKFRLLNVTLKALFFWLSPSAFE